MPQVLFIGMGLNDEKGMTIEGLEAARKADSVFAEFYTTIMPNLQLARLEQSIGKKVEVLNRAQLEDEDGRKIVSAAELGDVAFLVPGDPMIATTHVSMRLTLAKKGIGSRIINAASIFSAICGGTGLQSYKFGKSITLPRDGPPPPSVLNVIRENKNRSLHTLLLLEFKSGEVDQLTIDKALSKLITTDPNTVEWLAVGVARLGSLDQTVRAGRAGTLARVDFGRVPHSIVFPGNLHFMEAESLKVFAGASDKDLEGSL